MKKEVEVIMRTTQTTKKITRRMSLEQDFMHFGTDDLLYGYLRSLSTSKPNQGELKNDELRFEYLTFKEYAKNRQNITRALGCSTRSLKNKMAKLEKAGLLGESSITVDGEEYPCYTFPYNYNGKFKYVSKDMLRYLIDTRSPNVIRVYLFLLDKSYKPEYTFTLRDLKIAMGYNPASQSPNVTFTNILNSLQREGILTIRKEWVPIFGAEGEQTATERMVLIHVVNDPDELDKNAKQSI